MNILRQSFQVPFSFPIYFTEHVFSADNKELADFLAAGEPAGFKRKILFLADEGLAEKQPDLILDIRRYFQNQPFISLIEEILVLPGGEIAKNDPQVLAQTLAAIDRHGIDRHSFVAAIGGGAFLDMAGYAAAIAHRGVRHIRFPSTVLSQNDSGVGVKNGVNFAGKKNFLGTFSPPVAVFNDAALLKTLSDRDWRSGLSEAVKVALIKDLSFFEWLETHADALARRDLPAMREQIYRSACLHMAHIASGDPFELGSARPLDFGHWAAHKLEYLTDFGLRHGEAVAIGIALDSIYSQLLGLVSPEATRGIIALLKKLGFSLSHPALNDHAGLLAGLDEFREHLGGQLTITVLEKPGKGREIHEVNFSLMQEAIEQLKQA